MRLRPAECNLDRAKIRSTRPRGDPNVAPMATTPVSTAASPATGAQPQPMFYRRLVPLTAARHSALSLAPVVEYGFAREAKAIPLVTAEFGAAIRHYPIVFAARPTIPVALVGIDTGGNLFVDPGGKWLEGAHIPGYVRRYPFILVPTPGTDDFVLGIDEAARVLAPGEENGLFRDGRPTAALDRALAFCRDYQASVATTRQFCEALEAEGLLVDKEADIELKSGRRTRLTGFRVVDEARFNKLPGKTFLAFRQRGWLHPIYLHLVASQNWATLVDLAAPRLG